MILGFLIRCTGCDTQMMVSRQVAHYCPACLDRASDHQIEFPLGEVQI